MSQEFIKTIELNYAERFQFNKLTRAIVLIVEDFSPEDEFCEWIENFEVPVILALKARTNEKLVSAVHLCVAAQSAEIDKYSAKEGLKLGLINKIVSRTDVETEAASLAGKISSLAPLAIRAYLKAINKGLKMPLEGGLNLETGLFSKIFSTADMREGITAFLEKRKPVFEGK